MCILDPVLVLKKLFCLLPQADGAADPHVHVDLGQMPGFHFALLGLLNRILEEVLSEDLLWRF